MRLNSWPPPLKRLYISASPTGLIRRSLQSAGCANPVQKHRSSFLIPHSPINMP